ncbi:hypothetical protein [Erwinia pyrifoliae]|uniref:hypothetical protein n=1 Tax=Erwinia pyrifoliae TaxID=79967 RepID=UPI00223BE1C8|nr:hypothetical protein [Erwinia pyrifoliae]MCT2387650.1 hypothetical protein [Erwinia pyrifoliae]
MLKRLLSQFTGHRQQVESRLRHQYQMEDSGLSFSFERVTDEQLWALKAWLEQLADEDYLIELADRWLLTWDELYRLLEDEEHASSLALLGVPAILPLRASLSSGGALSDEDFQLYLGEWQASDSGRTVTVSLVRPIFNHDGHPRLLTKADWQLIQGLKQFHARQRSAPGELTNQIGWANVRKLDCPYASRRSYRIFGLPLCQ